jgi:mycothiol synthase
VTAWNIRTYCSGDEEAWLELIRACRDLRQEFLNRSPSLDALRVVIEHPHMDSQHNLFFAASGGQFVGYAETWCTPATPRAVGRVLVHPHWRRRGLGSALLARVSQRAAVVGGRYLDIAVGEEQDAGREFLCRRGFRAVHYAWKMSLPQLDAAPLPKWPAGYEVRSFVPGRDEQTAVSLENECFADGWEYLPVEVGEIEGFVRSPSFRADGVIFAVHGGRVVGECWNWIDDERIARTGDNRGDIWCLCVHPQHRGRGLGRALLLAGVDWLRSRGIESAYLSVDGANDRAKHLYPSVGFVTQHRSVWHRTNLCDESPGCESV